MRLSDSLGAVQGQMACGGYAVGPELGLHLKDDRHVSYHRSTYLGARCYYAVWSGTEYVFTRPPGPGGGL